MSDPNQNPIDVDRQAEIDAHRTADNVEVKHEKPDESTLVLDYGALVKQEPLDGDCTETCHNAYDSLFDVIKHEICSKSSEIDHQSLPADFAHTLYTSLKKEHRSMGDFKMDEASSVKQNDFKPRTQQTLNKDKHTDNCEMNREDSARDGSVARYGDTHTRETLFSCHHCLYQTGYKRYLVKHTRTHTGEKQHSCKYCDYKSLEASKLKRHMRTHTGEKPHFCKYCDYNSSEASKLKRHMRTHTGEKPHSCEYCDYKCSHAGQLKIHLRTHSGEKPYSCKYCDYKSSQASNLKSHMKRQHK